MRRMKRLLSLLLVLCMVFAMVPSFAAAAGTASIVATYEHNGSTTTFGYQDNGDSTYSVTEGSNVTTDTTYSSYLDGSLDKATEIAFVLAMMAAKENGYVGTVTLYQDVTLAKSSNMSSKGPFGLGSDNYTMFGQLAKNAELVINLNGKTLQSSVSKRFMDIGTQTNSANGKLTINGGSDNGVNGKIDWPKEMCYANAANVVLTFNNVDITVAGSKGIAQFRAPTVSGTYNFNGGNLTSAVMFSAGTAGFGKGATINVGDGFIFNGTGAVAMNFGDSTSKVNIGEATFNLGAGAVNTTKAISAVATITLLNDVVHKVDGTKHVFAVQATLYVIEVDIGANGSVTGAPEEAAAGEEITLTITPDDGFVLDKLVFNGVEKEVTGTTYTFTMPDEEVVVEVFFKDVPDNYRAVVIGAMTGGTVTAVPKYAPAGQTVTLTVATDDGFVFEALTVNGEPVTVTEGVATFTMTDEDANVSAAFRMLTTKAAVYSNGTDEPITYYTAKVDNAELKAYSTMAKAMDAALTEWKANGTGTITLYQNYTIPGKTAASSGQNAIQLTNNQSLILDLNGYTLDMDTSVKYNNGSENYRMFSANSTSADTYLEVKNGKLNYAGNQYIVNFGSSTIVIRCATFKFTEVDMTYSGTAARSMVLSGTSDFKVIFDGGSFTTTKPMGPSSSAADKVSGTKIYLRGGVKVTTTETSLVGFGNYNNGTLYLENAKVYTAGTGTTADSGYGILTAADPAARIVLGDGTIPSIISKSSQKNYNYNGTMLYTHTILPLGSTEQKPDSVVKIGSAFLNMEELIMYLPKAKDGDVITAVEHLDGRETEHYEDTQTLPVLETSANVTYDFGNYVVTADLAASADLTIEGGTLNISKPIELSNGATITVRNNTTIDASAGTAATGTGNIIFKEAVVKFRTGSEPYGSVYTEGKYTAEELDNVTTRTYTIPGDPVQGENSVVLLVESERYFDSLDEAVEAASRLSSETVQLVADTNEPALTIDKGITIDLGGFKAFTEFNVISGEVIIKNGTVASADADAIVVDGGNVTLNGLTVASVKNAVVINNGATTATITDCTLTGDSDRTDDGYALDIQAAASVAMDNITFITGAAAKAAICVGANVSYGNVALTSGEIYIPKAFYDANLNWAEGQDKISALDSISRYAYPTNVANDAAGTTYESELYCATVSAPTVMIGKVSYASLKDAVNQANTMSNATIVLMRDIHMDEEVNLSTASEYLLDMKKDMTIDFNGYTVYNPSEDHVLFRNYSSGLTITFKNGKIVDQCATGTKGTIFFRYGPTITLENMYIKSATAFVQYSGATTHVKLIGSTLESAGSYAINFSCSETEGTQSNIRLTMTDGSRLIGQKNGFYPNASLDYANSIELDDAYIYSTEKIANYLNIVNAPNEPYKEGDNFVYYYSSSNSPVAKYDDVDYFSIGSAVMDAEDNGGGVVTLQKDVRLLENISLTSGVKLDLAGYDISFGNAGSLSLEDGGEILTNGGSINSDGQVAVKNGAIIDGYTYTADAALNTKLNLKAVSLTLNEYVDINLKYSESDLSAFNQVMVFKNGEQISNPATANGCKIYKIENLKVSDYATNYAVVMTANSGNTACVGMPVQVSIKEYAKKVVADTTNYGYDSKLGKTMTAMMDHAGAAAEFPGMLHAATAELGTVKEVTNGVISMTADFANGYEMNFAVTLDPATSGTLIVKHTDIYGSAFEHEYAVNNSQTTAVYSLLHAADAKRVVTASLVVNGIEISRLETTLASAGTTADKALIVSNHAEQLFAGN